MENITINRLELASELATQRLIKAYNLLTEDDLYELGDDGCQYMSDRYEDEYADYYEEYLEIIDSCMVQTEYEELKMIEDNMTESIVHRLDFTYNDKMYRYLIWFTDPDEWQVLTTPSGIVFDVHYCEDYNAIVVYLSKDRDGKEYELGTQPVIYSKPIRPEEGEKA